VAAKRAYYETEGNVDGLDEKVLLEATLFGLPQYRVTAHAAARLEVTGTSESAGHFRANTLTAVRMSARYEPADNAIVITDTLHGQYYTLDDRAQVDDKEAVQPKHLSNLATAGGRAHGVLFRGGQYEDHPAFDPVVVAASLITGTASVEPAIGAGGWSPPVVAAVNAFLGIEGRQQERLAVQFGQYQREREIERLYSRLTVDVYYSDAADYEPPTIRFLRGRLVGDLIELEVEAEDASGIDGVIVAITAADGHWRTLDLIQDVAAGVWRGSIPNAPGLEYFVQVVDGAGNVATDHNHRQYYAAPPSCGCTLSYDWDVDCAVTVNDLSTLASHWRETPASPHWDPRFDVDGDGVITALDLMIVAVRIGAGCGG
jgi:hypothetical protein